MADRIEIRRPTEEEIRAEGCRAWPIWEKEISEFPWAYDEREACLILAGRVEVTPEGGAAVSFGAGDLVVFPAGMRCRWKVLEPVRKHYRFG